MIWVEYASICSKCNYRHVALASIVSKVCETIIYYHIAYCLIKCDNQAKHSSDMCIFKDAALKYKSFNTNVYIAKG